MLTSTSNVKRHTENGVTTDFPFNFKVDSPTELEVDSIDLAGVPTRLSYPGDFTVTGLHDNDGGYITKVAGTNGFDLLIRRITPTTQTTKLRGQTELDPVVLEDALDKLAKVDQQHAEELTRTFRSSVEGIDTELPEPVAGYALGWDATGTKLENVPNTGVDQTIVLNGKMADLASTSNTTKGSWMVGWLSKLAGAVGRILGDKLDEYTSVKDFGAVGDGVANDTAAFNAALSACKSLGRTLTIPDGNYKLTAGAVNFAGQGLNIIGQGRPTLTFTGAGMAFVLDTEAADGAFLEEMRVENLLIVGNPNITTGFYSRGIVRSIFRNIEVRECALDAFDIRHGVSNTYDTIRYSAQGHTTKALRGIRIRANGAGFYTADCTFINAVSEDFPGFGLYIEDGSGNVFIGGTFEGCANGAVILAGCRRNKLSNVWFEVNAARDLSDDGTLNSYDDCFFVSASSSPTVSIGTGKGTIFKGGYIRTIQLDSSSSDTLFLGVGMDENLSGTLGITGSGTYKAIGMTKINGSGNVVGQMQDFVGNEGTWAPVDGSGAALIYTGANGYYTKIGRLVFAQGTVTFPTNANGSPASIGGLPFTVRNVAGARQGFVSFTDETTLYSILPDAGGNTVALRTSAGASITNATMSGKTVWFTALYFIS